jgi:hypothetical protein
MFREKRFRRMFQRVERSKKHESSIALVQGAGLIAGGITAAIYFIKDLTDGNSELINLIKSLVYVSNRNFG